MYIWAGRVAFYLREAAKRKINLARFVWLKESVLLGHAKNVRLGLALIWSDVISKLTRHRWCPTGIVSMIAQNLSFSLHQYSPIQLPNSRGQCFQERITIRCFLKSIFQTCKNRVFTNGNLTNEFFPSRGIRQVLYPFTSLCYVWRGSSIALLRLPT